MYEIWIWKLFDCRRLLVICFYSAPSNSNSNSKVVNSILYRIWILKLFDFRRVLMICFYSAPSMCIIRWWLASLWWVCWWISPDTSPPVGRPDMRGSTQMREHHFYSATRTRLPRPTPTISAGSVSNHHNSIQFNSIQFKNIDLDSILHMTSNKTNM